MEKRIFAAVLISIALLWIWAAIAPKLFPDLIKQPRPNTPQPTAASKRAASPAAQAPTTTTPSVEPQTSAPAPRTDSKPTSAQTQVLTRVETPDFIATFSNRGAELVSFKLVHYQTKPKGGEPVELVKAREPQRTRDVRREFEMVQQIFEDVAPRRECRGFDARAERRRIGHLAQLRPLRRRNPLRQRRGCGRHGVSGDDENQQNGCDVRRERHDSPL